MTISLAGRVAIVTGAGGGLGRAHALLLARYGATVVVNDLAAEPADAVAAEIRAAGGEALAIAASVSDEAAVRAMVDTAISHFGKVDILVCNAGILRDKSFAKMTMADFRLVVDVHLMGAVYCAHAVWSHMRERGFGRIIFTTSSSGLYGNFGQANYGAAKMAVVGLMQTLSIEGARNDIRVNCLAPSAATGMTEGVFDDESFNALAPELVSPAVVALSADDAPTRAILLAGAGAFEQAHVTMTQGRHLGYKGDIASALLDQLDAIGAPDGQVVPAQGFAQSAHELELAAGNAGG